MKHDDTAGRDQDADQDDVLAAEGLSILEDALSLRDDNAPSLLERGDIPREFDGLVLQERIGAGGMGEVYRARQLELERDVAVKIRVARTCDAPFADRVIANEARILAELDHPGIARVHATGEVEGRRYLVMEHIEGCSLAERMEHSIPVAEALDVLLGIARALAVAHAHDLPHRDLKPSNVLIVDAPSGTPLDERIRLIDFGLAGRLFETEEVSQMGTRLYMAPEQRSGAVAGAAADIYALRQTFAQLVDDDWLQIASPMRRLLRRMAATKPEDRPTAAEVARAVADYRNRKSSLGLRHVAGLATAAVALGLIGWFTFRDRPTDLVEDSTSEVESGARLIERKKEFQDRRQRFMALVEELRNGQPDDLPISQEDLVYLQERAPRVLPQLYEEVARQLRRYSVEVPESQHPEVDKNR